MFRVIQQIRPAWVVGENVAGFVAMELDNCISDLEREGYAVQALVIPACAVDARHRRDRVWIVGHAEERGIRRGEASGSSGQFAQSGEDVAHADRSAAREYSRELHGDETKHEIGAAQHNNGFERGGEDVANAEDRGPSMRGWASGNGRHAIRSDMPATGGSAATWLPEPDVGRVAHGIPRRVDRLKGLGNAIVPQGAYEILRVIAQIESDG